MKRIIALATVMALAGSILTGCGNKPKTEPSSTNAAPSEQVTETSEDTTEETEDSSGATGAPAVTHTVEVTDQSVTTLKDDYDEYSMIIPKLVVDGVEADEINAALSDHIKAEYPMVEEDYGVSGTTTRYAWGVRGKIVSIIIIFKEIGTDYRGFEVFNYNLDTLRAADNEEVIMAFGMTPDEFGSKVADAYTAWWDGSNRPTTDKTYLDQSIDAISSTTVTPCALPNGDIGAAGTIYLSPETSQFTEKILCFDLETLEVASI